MRILYIHQYFVEPSGSGGTRSYEFARRLVRDGHQVTMLTSTAFLEPHRISDRGVSRFEVAGISVVALPIRYRNSFGAARRVAAFVRFAMASAWHASRAQRPDVIFATSTPLTVIIPALAAKVRHRCVMVFEVRDLWPSIPIAMGYLRSKPLRWVARMLERIAYASADSIIALSPGMEAGVRTINEDKTPIAMIPNSSDIDAHSTGDLDRLPSVWPDLSGRRLITYAGTIGPANDLAWLIRVAEQISSTDGVAIAIVGDGKERPEIERLALEAGLLGTRVFVLPPIAKSDIPCVLRRSTLCLCLFADEPLLETTSPNKLFDAFAAGRPIAINYGGWQQSLLEDSGAGIVLSRDEHEAATEIERFMADTDRQDRCGLMARELALTRFDRELLYRQIVEVLSNATRSSLS